jgi:hypothetical protein
MIRTGKAKVPSGTTWHGTQAPAHEISTPVRTPGATPAKFNPETGQWEEPYLGILQQKTPRTLQPSSQFETRNVLRTRSEAPTFPSSEVSREMGQGGSKRFFQERELGKGSIFQREQTPTDFYDPRRTLETGYPTRKGGIQDVLDQRKAHRIKQAKIEEAAENVLQQAATSARQKLPPSKAAVIPFRPTEIPRGVPIESAAKQINPKIAERFRKQAAEFRNKRNQFRRIVQREVEKNPFRANVREKAWEKIYNSKDWKKYIKDKTKLKNEINKKAPDLMEFEPHKVTQETIGPQRLHSKILGVEGEGSEQYLEKLYDIGTTRIPNKKLVDTFKKGNILKRSSGGQLNKPRGWGAARYKK